jgi:small subunit ribosomal protein S8
MSIDTIGDFLTVIRNGLQRARPFVVVPHSGLKQAMLETLKAEGFIRDYAVLGESDVKKSLKVYLKYVDGESVIHELSRVSRPGCRHYAQVTTKGRHKIKPVIGGLGISIVTTSSGVMTHKKAKNLGVGGEVLCTVW